MMARKSSRGVKQRGRLGPEELLRNLGSPIVPLLSPPKKRVQLQIVGFYFNFIQLRARRRISLVGVPPPARFWARPLIIFVVRP